MRSYWTRLGSKSNDWCFIRERRERLVYRDIDGTDKERKMEAEIGVVGPQVKRDAWGH